ncbi:MAG TPA: hypothetical protein VF288_09095 [Mycobacteriales bacterium]
MTVRPLPHRGPAAEAEPIEKLDDRDLLGRVLAGLSDDADELEACTGDLLVHADGRVECLARDDCPTDPALHVGVVHCEHDLADGCCATGG